MTIDALEEYYFATKPTTPSSKSVSTRTPNQLNPCHGFVLSENLQYPPLSILLELTKPRE